jgi:hypothetical protein
MNVAGWKRLGENTLKHHRNRTLDNNGAEICNNVGTRDVISRPWWWRG